MLNQYNDFVNRAVTQPCFLKEVTVKKDIATVISQEVIATDIYSMWISTDLSMDAKPGQFLEIYPKTSSLLLPRPISICEIDKDNNALRIVYRIAGNGTAEFSSYKEGDKITIVGPCGNGFPIEAAKGKSVFCIGGGIGIPPMIGTANALQGVSNTTAVIAGYRNELFLDKEAQKYGELYVATEDGSAGSKGNVINSINDNKLKADIIFACGPMPMLRALAEYARKNNIECYISLEERMACGVGACLGCITKTKHVDDHSKVNNTRICTEGPVFNIEEVMI